MPRLLPAPSEILRNLAGAFELLRGRRGGMAYFGDDATAVWQSFFAAVIVAPGWILLGQVGATAAGMEPGANVSLGRLVFDVLVYAVSWMAFPVIAHQLCAARGREDLWPRFVVALNWSKVWQGLIYIPAIVLTQLGYLGELGPLVTLLAMLAVLLYQWFIIRLSLELGGFAAAGYVLLDLAVGVMIAIASGGAAV